MGDICRNIIYNIILMGIIWNLYFWFLFPPIECVLQSNDRLDFAKTLTWKVEENTVFYLMVTCLLWHWYMI